MPLRNCNRHSQALLADSACDGSKPKADPPWGPASDVATNPSGFTRGPIRGIMAACPSSPAAAILMPDKRAGWSITRRARRHDRDPLWQPFRHRYDHRNHGSRPLRKLAIILAASLVAGGGLWLALRPPRLSQ